MDKNKKVLILEFLIQCGPEPSSMGDIRDAVGGSRTSVKGHVRDLRNKGLIRMEKHSGADGGWHHAYFATSAASSYTPSSREDPLSPERRKTLIVQFLSERGSGPTSMKHITDAVEGSYSTIQRYVRALIKEGFVRAERGNSQGRGWKWSYFVILAAVDSSKYAKQEMLGSEIVEEGPFDKDPFWASIDKAIKRAEKDRLRREAGKDRLRRERNIR